MRSVIGPGTPRMSGAVFGRREFLMIDASRCSEMLRRYRLLRGAARVTLALAACTPALYAQATTTASKTTDVSVFAGFSSVTPDYSEQRDTGLTFGANATRYFKFPVKPGIETRFTLSHGPIVNENFLLLGPRAQYDIKRFHPYADFLFGRGSIGYNFANPTNASSGGFVKSPGIGVDIDVFRNFQVKLDYQHEMWNLGTNYSLSPNVVTFGVTWHIPFKQRYDHAMH